MYHHVLVPVAFDHGDPGRHALVVARKLLHDGGRVSLLNVMEEIPAYVATYLPAGTLEANRADAIARLETLAKTVGEDCGSAVIWGHPNTAILQWAEEHSVDCIVIASHKPGLEDYFLGSTASRIVRHAKCGVHVLR